LFNIRYIQYSEYNPLVELTHIAKMSSIGISCPDCLTGFVKGGTPTGTVTTIHGLQTYVARPVGTPKAVIVFIPDAFGWELSNPRLLADTYAKKGGYLVYLPNFMNGG
jgi:hypothetical protein